MPLLLVLYFLKLRRQRKWIASTLLWRQSFEDLQANVPFQRLRWSWLLLLQLLLLVLLILALGRPVLEGAAPTSARLILLIDRSASMNALVGGVDEWAAEGEDAKSRLDRAKEAAREVVERLTRSGDERRLMVLTFAADARVVCGFTSRVGVLLDAIESIEPTDEAANLDRALQLAGAFAGVGGAGEDELDQPPDVLLISDGGVGRSQEPGGFSLRAGGFQFLAVGSETAEAGEVGGDMGVESARGGTGVGGAGVWGAGGGGANVGGGNVGIANFSARRDYEDPGRVAVFTRLVNTAPEPVETVVTLYVDGEPVETRRLEIPGTGAAASAAGTDAPEDSAPENDYEAELPALGEAPLSMAIDLPGAGVLSVHHNHRDALAVDDVAALVMADPRRPRIALVHADENADAFLEKAILDCEPESVRSMSLEAYQARPADQIDAATAFDLVVFDRVSPHRLPGVPTLTIGGAPATGTDSGLKAIEPGRGGGKRILSWDRQHPVMRYVSLDRVLFTGFGAYELPDGATALAHGPDGPVMAVLRTRGARHVVVGFALGNSDWPMQVSFVVFVKNALDYLTLGGFTGNTPGGSEGEEGAASHAWGQIGLVGHPGESISVRARPGVRELVVEGPQEASVSVQPGQAAVLPILRRAGLYVVKGASEPMDQLALSVLSDEESDIRPRRQVVVNAEAAAAGSIGASAPLELWPYLAAACIPLLVAEWLIYCRRNAR